MPQTRRKTSQNGCREGEEVSKGETDACERKPGQIEFIAAMPAGMREEMTRDREAQAGRAHEQGMKTDELALKADEEAQKAEEQACHLVEILENNLSSLRPEAQQYTGRACNTVKSELLEEVQTLKGKVLNLRGEVEAKDRRLREVATLHPP